MLLISGRILSISFFILLNTILSASIPIIYLSYATLIRLYGRVAIIFKYSNINLYQTFLALQMLSLRPVFLIHKLMCLKIFPLEILLSVYHNLLVCEWGNREISVERKGHLLTYIQI